MSTPRPFTFYTDGTGIFYTVDGVNFIQVGGGAAGSIPLSELATQAQATVVGNPSGSGTQSPVALTATQLTALINPATVSLPGAMSAAQFVALQNVGAYQITIDWTTTGDKGVIPGLAARSGAAFIIHRYSTVVNAVTGTASGSAPAINVGTATGTNFNDILSAVSPLTVGQVNNGVGEAINTNVAGYIAQHNSDIHVYAPTAVTGSTVLSVTLSFLGSWVSF